MSRRKEQAEKVAQELLKPDVELTEAQIARKKRCYNMATAYIENRMNGRARIKDIAEEYNLSVTAAMGNIAIGMAMFYPSAELKDEMREEQFARVRMIQDAHMERAVSTERVARGIDGKPIFGEDGKPLVVYDEKSAVAASVVMKSAETMSKLFGLSKERDRGNPEDDVMKSLSTMKLNELLELQDRIKDGNTSG